MRWDRSAVKNSVAALKHKIICHAFLPPSWLPQQYSTLRTSTVPASSWFILSTRQLPPRSLHSHTLPYINFQNVFDLIKSFRAQILASPFYLIILTTPLKAELKKLVLSYHQPRTREIQWDNVLFCSTSKGKEVRPKELLPMKYL